jgi:hypothetical protein
MTALTVLIANHNTAPFLELSLRALDALTDGDLTVHVNDDGSAPEDVARLERAAAAYPAVHVHHHRSGLPGSHAHGAALDHLFGFVETPYTAVLDADCTPLLAGWDTALVGLLDDRVKVVGSTLGEGWSGNKETDFPLPFLALFETETMRRLGVSATPGDIAAGQDTCWEWRAKLPPAGFAGRTLRSVNTRHDPAPPFDEVVCGVYYAPDGRIVGSHFGRGSNPAAKRPREAGRGTALLRRLGGRRRAAVRAWERERARWLEICGRIVDEQRRGGPT